MPRSTVIAGYYVQRARQQVARLGVYLDPRTRLTYVIDGPDGLSLSVNCHQNACLRSSSPSSGVRTFSIDDLTPKLEMTQRQTTLPSHM
jgi:hypothetical protein